MNSTQNSLVEAVESDAFAFFRHLGISHQTDRAQALIRSWQQNPSTMPFQRIAHSMEFIDTPENRVQLMHFIVMTEMERIEHDHSISDWIYQEAKRLNDSYRNQIGGLSVDHRENAGAIAALRKSMDEQADIMRSCSGRLGSKKIEALRHIYLHDELSQNIWVHALDYTHPSFPEFSKEKHDLTVFDGIFDTAHRKLGTALGMTAQVAPHDEIWIDSLQIVRTRVADEAVAVILWSPKDKEMRNELARLKRNERAKRREWKERANSARLGGIADNARAFLKEIKPRNKRWDALDPIKFLEVKLSEQDPAYRVLFDLVMCLVVSDPAYAASRTAHVDAMKDRIPRLAMKITKERALTDNLLPEEFRFLARLIVGDRNNVYNQNALSRFVFNGAIHVSGNGWKLTDSDIVSHLSVKYVLREMKKYCRNILGINPDDISREHRALISLWFTLDLSAPIPDALKSVAYNFISDPQFHSALLYFKARHCSDIQPSQCVDPSGKSTYTQVCAERMIQYGYDKLKVEMQAAEKTSVVDVDLAERFASFKPEVAQFFSEELFPHSAFTIFGNMAVQFRKAKNPIEALGLFVKRFIPVPPELERVTRDVGRVLHTRSMRDIIMADGIHEALHHIMRQVGSFEQLMQMELVEIMMLAVEYAQKLSGDEEGEDFGGWDEDDE
jgi:hypothetical protein